VKFGKPLLALLLFVPLLGLAAAEKPKVIATLSPVHSLVASVMHGIDEPRLLLPADASPHTHSLRPSEARALADADLVVWVGPELEQFMPKALSTLAGDADTLQLIELPGLTVLEGRDSADWQHVHDHDESHRHGHRDMHIWLDPLNAISIGHAVATRLAELDPERADHYRQNAGKLEKRLRELDARTRQALAPARNQPYVVFHDAYHYFEHRYDLHAAGTLTVSPDRPPGARQVAEIRERIQTRGVRCVFREPQFESRLIATLVRGTPATIGVLDPMGAELTPGPDAYFQLIENLAASLLRCLGTRQGDAE
jgi:zinc transport system substrate-binding protein